MIAKTEKTPIVLQEKHFWSTLALPENKRTLSLCLSESFIRALAQKSWRRLRLLRQGATRQPAMGKDFLGRHFSSNKLSEDLELTFPTVSMQCLWELKLCWPNPRVTAVSPTRDLCPSATFKIPLLFPLRVYLAFFMLHSNQRLLFLVILQPLSPAPFNKSTRHYCGSQCEHGELSGILGYWLKEVIDGRSRFPLPPSLCTALWWPSMRALIDPHISLNAPCWKVSIW